MTTAELIAEAEQHRNKSSCEARLIRNLAAALERANKVVEAMTLIANFDYTESGNPCDEMKDIARQAIDAYEKGPR